MARNKLDELLESLKNGTAEMPEAGAARTVGDVADHWPLYQEADGSEYYDTGGCRTKHVRTEVLREVGSCGVSMGVVRVDVLEPVRVAEVVDPDTGTVWWAAVEGGAR